MANEQRLSRLDRKKLTCKHFNGIQNKCCSAGVDYEQFRAYPKKPMGGFDFPCTANRSDNPPPCAVQEFPSPEEIEAEEKDYQRTIDLLQRGLSMCCEATLDTSRVIISGRHKGHGPRFCSNCKKLVYMV